MRNIIFAALVAAGMAIPGMANADSLVLSAPMMEQEKGIDQQLLEDILKYVEAHTAYDYGCLCDMYAAGDVDITKNQNGTYTVAIQEAGGGLSIILIEEIA